MSSRTAIHTSVSDKGSTSEYNGGVCDSVTRVVGGGGVGQSGEVKRDKGGCVLRRYEGLNKKDEMGIVIRNKARLVAQGYTQEERIDYDEALPLLQELKQLGYF
ncbi:hypothetical protein Tco_0033840 [Tanacetum coccineum]